MPTASRIAAARALHAVFGEGRRVPDRWDEGLSGADASFAQALLGLCLRRWGRLQAYVKPRLRDPERGLPLGSQIALAQGLAQLAWLEGVAPFAAVNESVGLVSDRDLGFPPHRGLVNALLRRAGEDVETLRMELAVLPPELDRPRFVERVLRAALAPHGALDRIEELAARIQSPPRVGFRRLRDAPLPEGLEPDPQIEGCLRLAEGAAFPRPWLRRGDGMAQDRSSQALMSFRWGAEPERVLDACAAPGGKTTLLGRRWPSASLFALELHPLRAERLKENLEARDVKAQVVVEDVELWLAEGGRPFDLILLDAPCSGSGTLQKHPELAWIGGGLDLARLQARQAALLEAAAARLAPGGLLLYAVCSWLPEEGEAQRARMLERHPELRPAEVWPPELGGDFFRPHPLDWEGEGFQAFALTRVP